MEEGWRQNGVARLHSTGRHTFGSWLMEWKAPLLSLVTKAGRIGEVNGYLPEISGLEMG